MIFRCVVPSIQTELTRNLSAQHRRFLYMPYGVCIRVLGPSNSCVDTPGCVQIRHFNCASTPVSAWLRRSICSHARLLVHVVQDIYVNRATQCRRPIPKSSWIPYSKPVNQRSPSSVPCNTYSYALVNTLAVSVPFINSSSNLGPFDPESQADEGCHGQERREGPICISRRILC